MKYSSDKIVCSSTLARSLEAIIPGADICSTPKTVEFETFGENISSDTFFMGKVNTKYIDTIEAKNVNKFILTIPIKGEFKIKTPGRQSKKSSCSIGTISLPTSDIKYSALSDHIIDYEVLIPPSELSPLIKKRFNISTIPQEVIELNGNSDRITTIRDFIESSIIMLQRFTAAQDSNLFKNSLKDIVTFMVADIIGENLNLKSLTRSDSDENLVILAEEFIDSECETIFSIQQIADTLNSTPRNIQLAFKKHREYPPMKFLKNRKLHKARTNILLHNQLTCSVKEIALGVGYFDLPRFSKYYYQLFGEHPSDTMRKARI